MKRIMTVAVGIILGFVPLGAREQDAEIDTNRTIAKLEQIIPSLMEQATVPGLSISLLAEGRPVWTKAFGFANREENVAAAKDTIFQAASLSKPVFTYAVLKLSDAGRLDLDAPLSDYLPNYIEDDERLGRISARRVLSHSTGFPNWRPGGGDLRIFFEPGARFSYSGEGFVYLQRVVEKIVARPLNEYMEVSVFGPLGMTSSSYVWVEPWAERIAAGHDFAGKANEISRRTEANAAASLITTAGDYARFLEAVFEGRGLKASTRRAWLQPQVWVDPTCTNCTQRVPAEVSTEIAWGLGWGVQLTEEGQSIWHWGDNGDFKCYVVGYPESGNGLVVFTNSTNGLGIHQVLVEAALGGRHPVNNWLSYEPYNGPSSEFLKGVLSGGLQKGIETLRSMIGTDRFRESWVNQLGYRLLRMNKLDDAVAVFELNVEVYPTSSNVYDSLGEAYMKRGDTGLAIQNYERSVELDPGNRNGVEALKKLRGGTDKE